MTRIKAHRSTATDLALIAAFAALIAVVTVAVPIPIVFGGVPTTLQTFGVLLAGAVLGARRGFLAVALYLLMGFAGLPVFANGGAGPAVFAGGTGGYLLGFLFAAPMCGFIVEKFLRKRAATNVALVFAAGLVSSALFIHTFGIAGLMINAEMPVKAAALLDVSFWIGDVIKNIAMAFVATAVHRAFPDILIERKRSR